MQKTNLFAAIAGKPNVGKSTLLNQLIGVKIAIVSPRPQTTRTKIMGVVTKGDQQTVLLDMPGYHQPKNKLDTRMQNTIHETVSEIDCVLFVTWCKEAFDEEEQELLKKIQFNRSPAILVINKADLLSGKKRGHEFLEKLSSRADFSDAVLVSALTGEGIGDLELAMRRFAQPGEHPFPEDTLTDIPEKVIAAEIIREKLLIFLRDELPHGCAVAVERFHERGASGLVDIDAEILCEKESHKGMIIGKGGAMLKRIGTEARADIETFLDCRINLQLWVKVRSDWRNKDYILRDLGY